MDMAVCLHTGWLLGMTRWRWWVHMACIFARSHGPLLPTAPACVR